MILKPFAPTPIHKLLQANLEHAARQLEHYACISEQEQAFVNQYSARIVRINDELKRDDCTIRKVLETNRYEAQRELEKHTCNFEQASAFVALHMGRRNRLTRELAAMAAERKPAGKPADPNPIIARGIADGTLSMQA